MGAGVLELNSVRRCLAVSPDRGEHPPAGAPEPADGARGGHEERLALLDVLVDGGLHHFPRPALRHPPLRRRREVEDGREEDAAGVGTPDHHQVRTYLVGILVVIPKVR